MSEDRLIRALSETASRLTDLGAEIKAEKARIKEVLQEVVSSEDLERIKAERQAETPDDMSERRRQKRIRRAS